MTVADDEMVAWLQGALNELERVALATTPRADESELHPQYDERAWKANPDGSVVEGRTDTLPVRRASDEAAAHIALHDPRAVLARVEAERALVAAESDDVLRILAWGHRFDAPGYRPEWSPE